MKWILIVISIPLTLIIFEFFYRFIVGYRWWVTPFDKKRKGEYDLFLSYKTEDSEIVRPIADNLLAVGIKVWFAEYELSLFKQLDLENLCLDGVENSKWGSRSLIYFTNSLNIVKMSTIK